MVGWVLGEDGAKRKNSKKTIGKALLTFSELETALIQIEAIINSRPISYVYNDHQEPEPLTPSHF